MTVPAVCWRVVVVLLLAASVAVAGTYYIVSADRGPTPGPLRPPRTVNSRGLWIENGTTMSFVVQLRGVDPVTVTLDGVSLNDPGSGLELVEAGVLVDGYPHTYASQTFPLGQLRPIAGEVYTTTPGNPEGDIFLNLGIHVELDTLSQDVEGVWLDYHIGDTRYRRLLPWLLTICRNPMTGVCGSLPADEFSFPPG